MTEPEPSLWISQIKQGKHFVGHMVADYNAKGAREYVLKTPVVAAAEELLAAVKDYAAAQSDMSSHFTLRMLQDSLVKVEPSNV